MTGLDKRTMERFSLEIPAYMQAADDSDGETKEYLTSDICSGGALFQTDQPMAVGTEVDVELVLPMDKLREIKSDRVHIRVSGAVIRTDARGMAVCFDKKYKILPLKP